MESFGVHVGEFPIDDSSQKGSESMLSLALKYKELFGNANKTIRLLKPRPFKVVFGV